MIVDRRRFLTAMGLAGGSLLLPSARRVRAETEPPKRLLVISSNQGQWRPSWRIPVPLSDDAPFEVPLVPLAADAFSPVLRPLHPWRDRMLALDGLALATANLDIVGHRHGKGLVHAWTGSWVLLEGNIWAVSPSVDQLVAARIARPDRLPSLELGLGIDVHTCSHAGAKHVLPPELDPRLAFDRVFGIARGGADPLAAARGSMLDAVADAYDALARRLGAADRAKLDVHRDLVRQLEARLVGLGELACAAEPPVLPDADAATVHGATFTAHAELAVAALACDATRVVSLSLGDPPSELLGLPATVVHDMVHEVFVREDARQLMEAYGRYTAERVAEVLTLLQAIPEGDGTLLDHTLVVWGSELGDPSHGFDRYCAVLIGGGWALDTGRMVHWPFGTTPIEGWSYTGPLEAMGLPHQHLLVTIAQAMGVDVDHVGLAAVSGQRGDVIDLRGGLPHPF